MTDQERIKAFAALNPGMSDADVVRTMGTPDANLSGVLPESSGWGQQSAVWIKIKPGEQYLQHVFLTKDKELAVWYAMVGDSWRVALKLTIPKPLSVLE
ncbi:MAG: hypothetical protein KDB03_26145 [Planctomycetales bacterium]|nr:hypothetical protein [Planctomycetales bacterium]